MTALGADVLAAETVADPEFASNPTKFVSWATTIAARAHGDGRKKSARFYTHVACLLAQAAGKARGAVLAGLVEDYGQPTGGATD